MGSIHSRWLALGISEPSTVSHYLLKKSIYLIYHIGSYNINFQFHAETHSLYSHSPICWGYHPTHLLWRIANREALDLQLTDFVAWFRLKRADFFFWVALPKFVPCKPTKIRFVVWQDFFSGWNVNVLNCVVCLRNNAVCIFTPKTLAIYIILYLELPYRDSSSPCLVQT